MLTSIERNIIINDDLMEFKNLHANYKLCKYVKFAIKKNSNKIALHLIQSENQFDRDFKFACAYRNYTIINYIITNYKPDWNSGIIGSAYGGHSVLFNFMLSLAQNAGIMVNWQNIVMAARYKSQLEIIKLIAAHGNYFDQELVIIFKSCTEAVMMFLLKYYESAKLPINWQELFIASCCNRSLKVIKEIWYAAKMANVKLELNVGFEKACHSGHLEILQYLALLGVADLTKGVRILCSRGNLTAIKCLVKISDKIEWNGCIPLAVNASQFKIVKFIKKMTTLEQGHF